MASSMAQAMKIIRRNNYSLEVLDAQKTEAYSVKFEAAEKIIGKMGKIVTVIASRAEIEKTPFQYAEELRLKA